jgi:hypothetical protein
LTVLKAFSLHNSKLGRPVKSQKIWGFSEVKKIFLSACGFLLLIGLLRANLRPVLEAKNARK